MGRHPKTFTNSVLLRSRPNGQSESNRRPLECHSSALPTELWPHAGRGVGTAASGILIYCSDLARPSARRPSGHGRQAQASSSSSTSPMMSVTSSSVSSCSSMKAASSRARHRFRSPPRRPRPPRPRRLLALLLGVRVFERNEFGLRRSPAPRPLLPPPRRRCRAGAAGSGRARVVTAASSMTVWHFGQTIGVLLRS